MTKVFQFLQEEQLIIFSLLSSARSSYMIFTRNNVNIYFTYIIFQIIAILTFIIFWQT